MKNIIKTKKGFTLVELVIVIVIVGILSVISVPVYRGYVEKAIKTEGQVLIGAIARAELAYHVQYGYFCSDGSGYGNYGGKGYYLDIDSSGNKYFVLWAAQPRNNFLLKGESLVYKTAQGDYEKDRIDYVDIYVGYPSPQGIIVLQMVASSNGGCSDIINRGVEAPEPESYEEVR